MAEACYLGICHRIAAEHVDGIDGIDLLGLAACFLLALAGSPSTVSLPLAQQPLPLLMCCMTCISFPLSLSLSHSQSLYVYLSSSLCACVHKRARTGAPLCVCG